MRKVLLTEREASMVLANWPAPSGIVWFKECVRSNTGLYEIYEAVTSGAYSTRHNRMAACIQIKSKK